MAQKFYGAAEREGIAWIAALAYGGQAAMGAPIDNARLPNPSGDPAMDSVAKVALRPFHFRTLTMISRIALSLLSSVTAT